MSRRLVLEGSVVAATAQPAGTWGAACSSFLVCRRWLAERPFGLSAEGVASNAPPAVAATTEPSRNRRDDSRERLFRGDMSAFFGHGALHHQHQKSK